MADSTVPVPAVVPGSSVVKPFDADAESVAADRAAVAADRAAVAADRAAVAVDRARAQAARATAVAARGLVAVDRAAVAVDRAAVAADRAAAATSASAAATGRALIQSATAAIAAVSVPALPWLIDGLPPSVLLLAGSGATMLAGGYVDVTDILTFSSAAKWVEGFDGTLYLSPANSPAYNWRTIGGVRVREILIESAGATNYLTRGQSPGLPGDWTHVGGPTVTEGVTDPIGTATATRLTLSDTASVYRPAAAYTANTRVEPPIWLRPVTSTGTLRISNPASATLGEWLVDLAALTAGVWQRVTRSHAAVTIVTEFATSASGGGGYWLRGVDALPISVEAWSAEIQPGTVATSTIPNDGWSVATRLPDDVRLTSAALAQAATETGATIVISGSAYGPDWVIGGAVGGAIFVSSGSYRPGDYGELVTPAGWSAPFGEFSVALGCAPSARRVSCNGGAVASSGISSAWSLATETSIRIGNATLGGSGSAQIYLRSLRIHPFIATDTGLQAASGV